MEPQITYTFSRALHMMRYSGAKMKPLYHSFYYMVNKNNKLTTKSIDGSKRFHTKAISYDEIMGSWIEVKD